MKHKNMEKDNVYYPPFSSKCVIGFDPIRYNVRKKRRNKCSIIVCRKESFEWNVISKYEGRPEKTAEEYKKDVENLLSLFPNQILENECFQPSKKSSRSST